MTGPLNFFIFMVYKLAVSVLISEGKVFAEEKPAEGHSGICPNSTMKGE